MNLYVHFPFCDSRCVYCALHSRIGSSRETRDAYCRDLAKDITSLDFSPFDTVYFGGGTPSCCDLAPVFAALASRLASNAEFTCEINPRDVTGSLVESLLNGGVNRVSMGVQSFDDSILAAMKRGHSADDAEYAFRVLRDCGFDNAGFDLIAGYPSSSPDSWRRTLERALALSPRHISCYSLIQEPHTALDVAIRRGVTVLPSDDAALDEVASAASSFAAAGFRRYEISNYSQPGFECRHNLAVWHGEDYIGVGEGAHGRIGLMRTVSGKTVQTLSPVEDARERAMFSLRLDTGFNPDSAVALFPALAEVAGKWAERLAALIPHGIVHMVNGAYVLTPRGLEVCDAVMAELD